MPDPPLILFCDESISKYPCILRPTFIRHSKTGVCWSFGQPKMCKSSKETLNKCCTFLAVYVLQTEISTSSGRLHQLQAMTISAFRHSKCTGLWKAMPHTTKICKCLCKSMHKTATSSQHNSGGGRAPPHPHTHTYFYLLVRKKVNPEKDSYCCTQRVFYLKKNSSAHLPFPYI